VFKVTVKEVKAPEETKIDDELAKKLGLEDLATLKERVREQLTEDFKGASRMHLKRRILDALDEVHSFPLPPAMVESEFQVPPSATTIRSRCCSAAAQQRCGAKRSSR